MIFTGAYFGLLIWTETVQGWLSWTLAIVTFAAYAIFGWLTHTDDEDQSPLEYMAKSEQMKRYEAKSWLASAPGWFIIRCLIRICGGPPPEKK